MDVRALTQFTQSSVNISSIGSVVIEVIKLTFPQFRTAASLGWNLTNLAMRLPSIYFETRDLCNRPDQKVEWYEIIPVLVNVKNIVLQGYSAKTAYDSLPNEQQRKIVAENESKSMQQNGEEHDSTVRAKL